MDVLTLGVVGGGLITYGIQIRSKYSTAFMISGGLLLAYGFYQYSNLDSGDK